MCDFCKILEEAKQDMKDPEVRINAASKLLDAAENSGDVNTMKKLIGEARDVLHPSVTNEMLWDACAARGHRKEECACPDVNRVV